MSKKGEEMKESRLGAQIFTIFSHKSKVGEVPVVGSSDFPNAFSQQT